jgi:sulfite reductase (NADPH) flavoprotein alpha-component
MTLSIWRYAHLALALISSLFIVMASVTGVILAIDAAQENAMPFKAAGFNQLTLSDAIPVLKQKFPEITEISVDHNGFVTLKGFDEDGNEVDAYINPNDAKIIGKPIEKSSFIQWVTAFHRSLFLKETGRWVIGIVSFLLIFIALSGMALVIQRQRSISKFFKKVVKEYFAQYYHIITGRIMLIPVLLIAVSGTYLSMVHLHLLPEFKINHQIKDASDPNLKLSAAKFALFQSIKLQDVKKIEFPFAEDPEEHYTIKLNDRELVVDQFSGKVLSEVRYPSTVILEDLSLDLHTGRGNLVWALVLAVASLNILFFVYSGFAITLKRRSAKIKNKHGLNDAEIVLLVGSENGNTLLFANAIHQQLLAKGHASYLLQLNQYQVFAKAKQLVVLTSTYGLGDAPSNANKFLSLIDQYPQQQKIDFSVVGFGSHAYPDFCKFATEVDDKLGAQAWANRLVPLHTVDDKSAVQFVDWVRDWGRATDIELATTPALYAKKPKGLHKMMVLDRSEVRGEEHTFLLTLQAPAGVRFTSGDLLAIYPANDAKERLYSVAKINGNIQLVVKLHPNGLGSTYLNDLKVGDTFKARLVPNVSFHVPKTKKVALIANGTGIAPFLGMISQNKKSIEMKLYAGFRNETTLVKKHIEFLSQHAIQHQLSDFQLAFSREQNQCYVMDLIKEDAVSLANLLKHNGVIMICGSLQMQQDVEKVLDEICLTINGLNLAAYKAKKQLLTDCY